MLPIVGSPETQLTSDLLYAMTASNLLLVAINLIPLAPLDGALAWRLVPLVFRRVKWTWDRSRRRAQAKASLERLERVEATLPAQVSDDLERQVQDIVERSSRGDQ